MERPKLVFREKRRGSTDEGAKEGGKEKEGAGEGGGRGGREREMESHGPPHPRRYATLYSLLQKWDSTPTTNPH